MLILIAFDGRGSWLFVLAGTSVLGVIYTGIGAAVATRYASINALLLPASVVVAFLLTPLLAHVGLAPRHLFLLHPLEPALTLIRAGYAPQVWENSALAEAARSPGAVVKVLNGVNLLPVAAFFVPTPLQYVAGIIPTHWPMRAFWSAAAGEDHLAELVIGAANGALALVLAAFMFERRLVRRG